MHNSKTVEGNGGLLDGGVDEETERNEFSYGKFGWCHEIKILCFDPDGGCGWR